MSLQYERLAFKRRAPDVGATFQPNPSRPRPQGTGIEQQLAGEEDLPTGILTAAEEGREGVAEGRARWADSSSQTRCWLEIAQRG
jgi:hypothetical protein